MQELGTPAEMLVGLALVGLGMFVLWLEQKRFGTLACQPLSIPPVQSTANTSDNTVDKRSTSGALVWLTCILFSAFLTAAGGWSVFGLYGAMSLLVLFFFVNTPVGISRMRRPPDPLTAFISHLEIRARISEGEIAQIREEIENCFRTAKIAGEKQRQLLRYLAYREDGIGKAARELLEQQDLEEKDGE